MLVLLIMSLVCYAVASLLTLMGVLGKHAKLKRYALAFALAGMGILTVILIYVSYLSLFSTTAMSREFYFLFVFGWILSVAALFTWYKLKNPLLLLILSPVLFLLIHTVMLIRENAFMEMTAVNAYYSGTLLYIHIGSLFASLALLVIGGIAGVLFLIQENAVKKKMQLSGFIKHFPPLEPLDKINFFATSFGFPLYTVGLACGFIWAGHVWGTFFSGDIKEIFSLCLWGLFAFLFHARFALGYKGKRPALYLLVLCIACLFSLLFLNIFLPTHHNFK